MRHVFQRARISFRRFARQTGGNVAIITALAAMPMLFLAGMGIDYGEAADKQSQLNALADAAALSAVTPNMMAQSVSAAQTQAIKLARQPALAIIVP